MIKTFVGLIGLGLLLNSSVSYAEGLTLKGEAGVAVSMSKPQTDKFDAGGQFSLKALVELHPIVDVGPVVSYLVLDNDSVPEAGTAFGVGAGLRFKRPHDFKNNPDTGLDAVSPWVDGSLQYIHTGDLDRAGLDAGFGLSFPTSDSRDLWVGPYVRYQNIIQEQKAGFDTRDSRVVSVGLSVEFDPSVTTRPQPKKAPPAKDPVTPPPTPVTPTPENPPPVVPEVKFELNQKVQFDWDSAVLRDTEFTALNQVVSALLKNKDYKVKVEGHASSEGKVEHNDKLSEKRANAVVDYLVSHGVSRDNLTASGFGSRVPVANNSTEEGRVQNRRVEFNVNVTLTK